MKLLRSLMLLGLLSVGGHAAGVDPSKLREGDIVFQTSRSTQSRAILRLRAGIRFEGSTKGHPGGSNLLPSCRS